jgi:hypothetical protein
MWNTEIVVSEVPQSLPEVLSNFDPLIVQVDKTSCRIAPYERVETLGSSIIDVFGINLCLAMSHDCILSEVG